MYWPTATSRVLSIPSPLDDAELLCVRPSRKGNFFACLSRAGIGIWDVRPTVMHAAVIRTERSVERWGENVDVFWATDGRGLIVLTTTSHLVLYTLQPTPNPAYDTPPAQPATYSAGPGEGGVLSGWALRPAGVAFVMGGCTSVLPLPHSLLLGLRHPPGLLEVPWPLPQTLVGGKTGNQYPPAPLDGADGQLWDMANTWMKPSPPLKLSVTRTQGLPAMYTMLTTDGRVWGMYTSVQAGQYQPGSSRTTSRFVGQAIYPPSRAHQGSSGNEVLGLVDAPDEVLENLEDEMRAVDFAVNTRMGLVAVGLAGGQVEMISVPPYPQPARRSHTLDLKASANLRTPPGSVTSLAWTSDGYALAVGYEHGWAVWSFGGRLGGWGLADEGSEESFMRGVHELFWAPGNLDLFALTKESSLYAIPFAKSATTGQHSPDNTRYAFLQMDDRVLVYRGADQPDLSVINPESDVWQHIKIPNAYITTNWPIRYASISNDGKLIAVSGRRGLTHYSASSGRWKLFADEREEAAFVVRGGLLWFHHVLVVAVEADKNFQIRLYSRDFDLAEANVLHAQNIPSPVLVMSLLDNSLLVYTADNTLYHFLILPTKDAIRLHLCGSISFVGIVRVPSRVRALSWLLPSAQKDLGDPADDLIVATMIFLVDGKLVLLRPRRAGNEEVRYDMQVLADRIEAYWTHLHGVGTLENSLWGYDGSGMRIWLDALTIEATKVDSVKDAYESVQESVHLRLDFYPLSILMDKGIIIGVDYETSLRNLPFALFKIQTGTHLFLPQLLRYHLSTGHLDSALVFATNYSSIAYFAHSLEILLHSVLEDEVDAGSLETLPRVVEFLDHFPESLDVVVGCARKSEVERWEVLFGVVGAPRELFERCAAGGRLRTAAGCLLVLHTLEELDDAKDTIRLLRLAIEAKEYHLCKELLRFLHSIDETGSALRHAIDEVGIVPDSPMPPSPPTPPPPTPPPPPAAAAPPLLTFRSDTPPTVARVLKSDRVNSPFELSLPRLFTSPPSPRTVETMPQPLEIPGDS
ncbi:RIC1-domain-containing protein [Naematelia encephala]|uniref:RIC1-domain-containing protein n=1 Tax=Naematelia encephala TaxID=71784 RepID=A0A1Y2BBB4_9TREE|nr:RIC1-domain-containing protein [Naematelia encephala]